MRIDLLMNSLHNIHYENGIQTADMLFFSNGPEKQPDSAY